MRLTKRISIVLATVLVLSLATPISFPATSGAIISAATKAPKLSETKKTLNVGKSFILKVSNAQKITWKSNKTSVATVNKNGKVSAIKAGTATITATIDKKKLKCKVTVNNQKISKAPFEANDYVAGDLNMVIPKGWQAESDFNEDIYYTLISGSECTIIIKDIVTGEPAEDYTEFKDYLMSVVTPEVLGDSFMNIFGLVGRVTDLVFEDYEMSLGTAVAITYTIHTINPLTFKIVKVYANGYFISVDNRNIQFETFTEPNETDDQKALDIGTYVFDSITIVK